MKTNTPHDPKSNRPDSDQMARNKHAYSGAEPIEDASADIGGLQTSNKTGKHSATEKLSASRPEFGEGRGAVPVDGAFGKDNDEHQVTGRNAGPGTNEFRCSACGRFFNSQNELAAHQAQCQLAKAATASGRDSLSQDQSSEHPRNDAGR
jgi:hypothetical protein